MLSALFLFGEYRIYNIIVSNIKTHAASSHATINQLSILSPMPPFGGSNRYEKRCPLRFSCVRLSTSPRNSLCCEWKLPQAARSTSHTNSHVAASRNLASICFIKSPPIVTGAQRMQQSLLLQLNRRLHHVYKRDNYDNSVCS